MELNDIWKLYFHDPFDENWEQDGYKELFTCSSVEEFWMMNSKLKEIIVHGMFFIMRSHIFPKWNDEANKDGGFLSIKILKDRMPTFTQNIIIKLINETLLKPEYQHLSKWINGLSVSPKKNFCILKIWIRNGQDLDNGDMFDIDNEYHGDIIFKTNTCN